MFTNLADGYTRAITFISGFSIYFKYFVAFFSTKNNDNFCKRQCIFINNVITNKFYKESDNICVVKYRFILFYISFDFLMKT